MPAAGTLGTTTDVHAVVAPFETGGWSAGLGAVIVFGCRWGQFEGVKFGWSGDLNDPGVDDELTQFKTIPLDTQTDSCHKTRTRQTVCTCVSQIGLIRWLAWIRFSHEYWVPHELNLPKSPMTYVHEDLKHIEYHEPSHWLFARPALT